MTRRTRNYLSQFLDVKDQHTYQQLGYLGDLSNEGLMFISPLNLTPNWIGDIYIENNVVEDDEAPVSVKAKIQALWIKPSLNPEMNCVGCKILEIDPDAKKRLHFVAHSFCFNPDLEVHRTSHPEQLTE